MTIDCDKEYFQISNGTWKGENLYQLYKKAYTPWEWHERLKDEAEKLGLDFLSTPFDKTAVDFLETLKVSFYKVASFELTDDTIYTFTDSNLLFVEDADSNRLYTTTKKKDFLKHLDASYSDDLPAQKVPFFVEVSDGKIVSVTEEFQFTI
ncbi:hypothetical protein SDC9_154164 [bioreactor metagenome]|uniref:PseI/NeuA/B-like domain-containing protein n=1 Tax=bioreactor metagenome TaxID=1076179 RepID=A0A645EYB0_9ZZZZ